MRDTFRFLLACVISLHACLSWAAEATRKYNPGHYVALPRYDDGPEAIADSMRPGVAGVQIRYTWRELEPAFGSYDFSEVAADLARLEGSGRQLVVFVCDKSFQNVRFTPEYLWAEHTLPVNSHMTGAGYISKRWHPYVVQRMSRLLAALGEAFDGHPRFEGVAIQETALGVEDAVLQAEGYSAAAYRDALISMLQSGAAAMPRSRVFWYANYMAGGQHQLYAVADAVRPLGVAIGGPDVLPEDWALENLVYPILRAQPRDAVVFNSAQFESYRHLHSAAGAATKYWTPWEIMAFARDDLAVRYLFWNRRTSPDPADSYDINDAYPVMAAGPLATVRPRAPVLL